MTRANAGGADEQNRVLVRVSDPWDLGESLRWRPLEGELLQIASDERGGRALIKLDDRIEYRGSVCRYVVAAPRHEGATIAAIQKGEKVFCNFTGISDSQAASSDPLDTSTWRGGVAIIGDLEPLG